MIDKVISYALTAQKEIVDAIDEHRFSDFKIEHAESFVRAVEGMTVGEGQSDGAFQLYRQSLMNHYKILVSLTDTITPMESAFLEWMQTPSTLEILYGLDSVWIGFVVQRSCSRVCKGC